MEKYTRENVKANLLVVIQPASSDLCTHMIGSSYFASF